MTPRLPGDLAPPLHILEPWPFQTLLLLAALIAILVYLIRRRRRKRGSGPPPSLPVTPPDPSGRHDFETRIRELKYRHLAARSFREGCYELARIARERWARRGHPEPGKMTAREIHHEVGDSKLSLFLLALADLRFRRREPEEKEFHEICDQAIKADRHLAGKAPS